MFLGFRLYQHSGRELIFDGKYMRKLRVRIMVSTWSFEFWY